MRETLLILAAFFSLHACAPAEKPAEPADAMESAEPAAAEPAEITIEELQAKMDEAGVVVLDVRTPDEFEAGHIGEAVNVDYLADNFAEKAAELDKEATYVVYCRTGNRSAKAIDIMKEAGFKHLLHYGGGWAEWSEAHTSDN